jgi:hypothetical protein
MTERKLIKKIKGLKINGKQIYEINLKLYKPEKAEWDAEIQEDRNKFPGLFKEHDKTMHAGDAYDEWVIERHMEGF